MRLVAAPPAGPRAAVVSSPPLLAVLALLLREFVRIGYAVIFLHRVGSKMPFIGALSDFATHVLTRSEVTQRDGRSEMHISDPQLMRAIQHYHEVRGKRRRCRWRGSAFRPRRGEARRQHA